MKKLCKILVLIMCLSFITATLFACTKSDNNDQPIETASFTLKEYHFSIYEGDTRKIEILSDDDLEYTFEVSNTEILSVDADGVVSGLKSGASAVTVKSGELSETMMVEVLENKRYIALNSTDTNKVVGSTFALVATVYDKGVDSSQTVEWTVSNDCPKEINGNTLTLNPNTTGYMTVTASIGDLTAVCKIKVVEVGATVLDTPSVTVENCKEIKWEAVSNATGYSVLVNGGEWVSVEDCSFTIEEVSEFKKGDKIAVAVRAISESTSFIDSTIKTVVLKHDFIESSVGAPSFTCTQAGTIKYECACGVNYTVENYVDKHNYVDGRCADCKKIQSEGVIYAYNEKLGVYYISGVQDGFASDELYALATYDNGKNGEKPVKYVGFKAFYQNTKIRKIVLPTSIVGLEGQCFSLMSNLEHLEMPGLTYTAQTPCYYPAFGEQGKTTFSNARDNWTDTYRLKIIVVGEGFKNDCRSFFTHKWSPDDYKPILDMYVMGSYVENIFSGSTRLGSLTMSVGAKDGENYQLTGEIYYYDETGEKCGHWWHYDEDGNVVKNKEHTIRENVCVNCGYVYNKNFHIKWVESLKAYEFMCVREGYSSSVITVPSTYNDGVHGEAEVASLGTGAFYNTTNLKKVVLPETVKVINSVAFGNCSVLEEVIMPGVEKIIGGNNFINCIKMNKMIVNNGISIGSQAFFAETSKYANYQSKVDAFITSQDEGKINLSQGGNNNMLTGTMYFYNENPGETHGKWWNYDANGDVVTIDVPHSYDSETDLCSCGQINPKGLKYSYNEQTESYIVTGTTANSTLKEIVVLAEYNDGKNGLRPVTALGETAFSGNKNITKIVLPESVTTIGHRAFMNCSALEALIAPGVTTFGYQGNNTEQTFQFAYCYSIKTVVLSGDITEIPTRVFYIDRDLDKDGVLDDQKITNICLTGNVNNIATIKAYNDLLTKDVYLFDETAIAQKTHGEWWGWKDGKQNGEIEAKVFEHKYVDGVCSCGRLNPNEIKFRYDQSTDSYIVVELTDNTKKEIEIPTQYNDGRNGLKNVKIIGEGAFRSSTIEKIILPATVTDINANAFMHSFALKTVIAPGVTNFNGQSHFAYCTALETVVLSGDLIQIGERVFYNDIDSDEDGVIDSCKKTNIYLSGSENNIVYTGSLYNQLLSGNVYLYNENPVEHGNWWKWATAVNGDITLATIEHAYIDGVCSCGKWDNKGIEYKYISGSYTVIGITDKLIETIEIPSQYNDGKNGTAAVTTIGREAFKSASAIKVVLPESVTIINNRAFMWCMNLETVIAPGVKEFTDADNMQFVYCESLKNVVLSADTTVIPARVFLNNADNNGDGLIAEKVTDILINGTENVYVSISSDNNSLLTGNVYAKSDDLTKHGKVWNYDLEGNVVKVINEHEFVDGACSCGQHSSEVPHKYVDGVCGCGYSIADNVVYEWVETNGSTAGYFKVVGLKNKNVDEVYIKGEHTDGVNTGKVLEIGKSAFAINTAPVGACTVKKIVMHKNVTKIDNTAMMQCTNLEAIIAPGVTTLGNHCFSYAESLKYVVLSGDITILPDNSFYDDDGGGTNPLVTNSVTLYLDGPTNNITSISNVGTGMLIKNAIYTRSDTYAENTWRYVDGVPTLWEQAQ